MATTTQPTAGEATKTLINYRVDGGVAVIEMFDPPANTYTYEMNRQLDEAILKARMDNNVHVIVLTGSGDKFFSAGANIKMLASVDPTFKYYFCLHANETLLRLEHTPKLVIAALNGHCVGGGLEIAMVFTARDAAWGFPEIRLGCYPPVACTALASLVGQKRSSELILTGRTFSGDEAVAIGLANQSAVAEDVPSLVENALTNLRRLSPAALSIAKKAIYAWDSMDYRILLGPQVVMRLIRLVARQWQREGRIESP